MNAKDQQILDKLAAAKADHQDLARLIDFHVALYTVQFEVKAQIAPEESWRDQAALQICVSNGAPQITFDNLGIEPAALAKVAQRIGGVLATHRRDLAKMGSSLAEIQPETLATVAREVYEQPGAWLRHPSSAQAFDKLAVELAVAPYVRRAAETLAPELDLAVWRRPYCPICGAAPDLSLLSKDSGMRYLVCSRCDTQWPYARLGCPFCMAPGNGRTKYYLSDDEVYRLYVCDSCKRYLKTVDLRKAPGEVIPAVARVLTAAMDIAARDKGYAA